MLRELGWRDLKFNVFPPSSLVHNILAQLVPPSDKLLVYMCGLAPSGRFILMVRPRLGMRLSCNSVRLHEPCKRLLNVYCNMVANNETQAAILSHDNTIIIVSNDHQQPVKSACQLSMNFNLVLLTAL